MSAPNASTTGNEFERCWPLLLTHEGNPGYVSPETAAKIGDPGGETKYGISKASYPTLDIAGLTEAQAKLLYLITWHKAGCDNLTWPLTWLVFDCAVNQGINRATRWLKITHDPQQYLQLRSNHYERLARTHPQFKRGWRNRINSLQRECGLRPVDR